MKIKGQYYFLSLFSLFFLSATTGFTSSKPPARELDVMTFNIRDAQMPDGINSWEARRPLLLSLVSGEGLDLIGFQEVTPPQRDDLQDGLGGFRSQGVGRDGAGKGEECPLFWRGDQAPIESGTFWLSPTPTVEGSQGWDASCPRVCSWVRWPGLTVFNAHLDADGEESRYQAMRLIREKAAGGPFIIMGDFNDREKSKALQPLDGLVDAYRKIHPDVRNVTSYHAFRGADFVGPRIDFIFVTPDIEVLDADIVRSPGPVYPSDHYPLMAHLRLPRPRN